MSNYPPAIEPTGLQLSVISIGTGNIMGPVILLMFAG
jgi:hypothetical protein